MCLISICGRGTDKNTEVVERFVKKGFESNRDGSGYMCKKHGEHTIFIDKGFFNLQALLASIRSHNLQKEDELIIHHRIGTSGAKDAANCHPFVLTSNKKEILTTQGKVNKPCLAHNGIFSGIWELEKENWGYSDTFTFCKDVLGQKELLELFYRDQNKFEYLFSRIIGTNKLAILFPDKDLTTIGTFIKDEHGYLHSNIGYKSYTKDVGGVNMSENLPAPISTFPKKSSGGNNSSSSGTHQGEYLPLVEPDGSSYTPAYQLTIADINISSRNYDHFYFVRKNDRSNEQVLEFKNFKNYGKEVEANHLVDVKNDKFLHEVKKPRLSEYYFYPKSEYNAVYKDFTYLMIALPEPGKKTIKKIFKNMNKVQIINTKDTLHLKRINKGINKYAVYLFYDFWADFWDQPSLEHVFKNADWAKSLKTVGIDKFNKRFNQETYGPKTEHCCTIPIKNKEYEDYELAISGEEDEFNRGPID